MRNNLFYLFFINFFALARTLEKMCIGEQVEPVEMPRDAQRERAKFERGEGGVRGKVDVCSLFLFFYISSNVVRCCTLAATKTNTKTGSHAADDNTHQVSKCIVTCAVEVSRDSWDET